VDAVDYLLKPFGLQDFQHAAERVKERYEAKHRTWTEDRPASGDEPVDPAAAELSAGETDEDALFLKTDYKTVRISMSDIRYVEAMSEYLKIYLEGQTKPLVVLLSMKKLEERLPSQVFMRIHRSYIINLTKIREVNKNRVIMDAQTSLPIGEMYKEAFQAYLDTRFLGK
jgi:DNA-binding LytR/AlgR family response regulator